jgi:outer membrane protein assembly factor BamB
VLWEVPRNWSEDYKANERVAVGMTRDGKIEALDLKTGQLLWEAPPCTNFELNDRHVTLKRMKGGKRESGGGLSLEEAAYGDDESIGYILQVLDAQTGGKLFERQSAGSHYWRVPVAVGDIVLLTDCFAHVLYAYEIASGKLRWQVKFENFFAIHPLILDGKIFMYMRRPKLKTIIQYVLSPETGAFLHQTDLQVNSLYARPILIGRTLFLYDPVAYELLGVDREKGGVIGRYGVKDVLTEVSHRNVVTLEGLKNYIFFYTWDGLVARFDVGEE